MTTQDANAGSSPAAADTNVTASPADTSSPPDNNAASQAAASGDNAASAPNAPVDDRAALLDIVRNVVEAPSKNPKGEDTKAAPDTTAPGTDPAQTEQAADAPTEDPDDAELDKLVPKTRARIKSLLSQRNGFKTEVETLKPSAERWQQMEGYLTRHDLAAEDVNLLLGVGAALRRGDFKAFLDGVAPYVELANQNLGNTLPKDLQTKVEEGELSDAAAKELSVLRLSTARAQAEAQARGTADQARVQAEQETRTATAVTQSVVAWEEGVKARDPDYAKKAATVLRVSQALMLQHGRPGTPEKAVEMAKAAYEETNRMFAAVLPAPVPTKPSPVNARAVNGARPEPKTMLEAMRIAMERGRQ